MMSLVMSQILFIYFILILFQVNKFIKKIFFAVAFNNLFPSDVANRLFIFILYLMILTIKRLTNILLNESISYRLYITTML